MYCNVTRLLSNRLQFSSFHQNPTRGFFLLQEGHEVDQNHSQQIETNSREFRAKIYDGLLTKEEIRMKRTIMIECFGSIIDHIKLAF